MIRLGSSSKAKSAAPTLRLLSTASAVGHARAGTAQTDKTLNSTIHADGVPVEFSNEFFEGRIAVMARSSINADDIVWTKTADVDEPLLEIRLQGHFKVLPDPFVLIGGEVPQTMHLSIVAKTLSRLVLKFAAAFNRTRVFRYTFGRESSSNNKSGDLPMMDEVPCVAFDLWRGADTMIVTPPEETPPSIDGRTRVAVEANADCDHVRRKSPPTVNSFNTRDTYTIIYTSRHIDVEKWQIVNLRGCPNIDLRRFWSDMPLRIVGFDILGDNVEEAKSNNRDANSPSAKRPLEQVRKRYFFAIEISSSLSPLPE